jgi:hypothetical protein
VPTESQKLLAQTVQQTLVQAVMVDIRLAVLPAVQVDQEL